MKACPTFLIFPVSQTIIKPLELTDNLISKFQCQWKTFMCFFSSNSSFFEKNTVFLKHQLLRKSLTGSDVRQTNTFTHAQTHMHNCLCDQTIVFFLCGDTGRVLNALVCLQCFPLSPCRDRWSCWLTAIRYCHQHNHSALS